MSANQYHEPQAKTSTVRPAPTSDDNSLVMEGTAPHLSPSFANSGWSGCSRGTSLRGKRQGDRFGICMYKQSVRIYIHTIQHRGGGGIISKQSLSTYIHTYIPDVAGRDVEHPDVLVGGLEHDGEDVEVPLRRRRHPAVVDDGLRQLQVRPVPDDRPVLEGVRGVSSLMRQKKSKRERERSIVKGRRARRAAGRVLQ